jgi:23S rRNA pseudouridine1911/1915/1917 synthase
VQGGEKVEIRANELEPNELPWQAEAIELDIIYEDKYILVINKPAGLVVHPGAGNWQGTLINGLLAFDDSLEALPRAGIVHRLDKNTSGVLVVARTIPMHTRLVRMLEKRRVSREYFAVVHGILTAGGTIVAPIGRDKFKRTKMAVVADGREAITHYRVKERFRAHSAVKVKLETGRTHQIRVHMAYQKMPLVGDKTYGGRLRLPKNCSAEFMEALQSFPRQALHAYRLGLAHPKTGAEVEFTAPLPDDINNLLAAMRTDLQEHHA